MKMRPLSFLLPAFCLPFLCPASSLRAEEKKNWVHGGKGDAGRFEQTVAAAYPWDGVDSAGFLRKSVALPSTNPFVTKSNQFTYAWLGSSASFVDMDGDGLPDIVSPDGAGIFWCWKNIGTSGHPEFGKGDVMPLLVDDLRSQFRPIFNQNTPPPPDKKLTSSEESAKRRIDERRNRELERLKESNKRQPKDKQVDESELEKKVIEKYPYDWEANAKPTPEPTPEGRVLPNASIPPGGLTCELNSFRRLRLIASPGDWKGDNLTGFIVGDSGGTIYFARNTGRPGGPPNFGYVNRYANSVPLKIAKVPGPPGKTATYEPVEFMNYAMPFACDWDGNGIPDVLVGEGTYSVNAIRLYRDAARATPANPPQEILLYVGEDRTFLAPFACDWDGDGLLDLFVCDSTGRLTAHRRTASPSAQPAAPGAQTAAKPHPVSAPCDTNVLEPAKDILLDGGNAPLAYCTPQPCDWNSDGIMDMIWGDPYGRIMVALGKEKGGVAFSAPFAVQSTCKPDTIRFPLYVGIAGCSARLSDENGGPSEGGTASAERFYRPDGSSRINTGGVLRDDNDKLWGLLPAWDDAKLPTVADVTGNDHTGSIRGKHSSWAIAPLPGDIWEVVDEPGAPGQGKTLLLRWHDWSKNAIFKTRTVAPPQWTPGVFLRFSSGRSEPFAEFYTKEAVRISFQMKLDGKFSRLQVIMRTNWGPNHPAEGGSFEGTPMVPPPIGKWFEYSYVQEPGDKYQRGLDGVLYIELLGEGEVRIRDVQITEGR